MGACAQKKPVWEDTRVVFWESEKRYEDKICYCDTKESEVINAGTSD